MAGVLRARVAEFAPGVEQRRRQAPPSAPWRQSRDQSPSGRLSEAPRLPCWSRCVGEGRSQATASDHLEPRIEHRQSDDRDQKGREGGTLLAPASMAYTGRCQHAQAAPSTRLARRLLQWSRRRGRAKPRQPSSSCNDPMNNPAMSPRGTSRTVLVSTRNSASFPTTSRWTATATRATAIGPPSASAYHRAPTRQSTSERSTRRTPAQPSSLAVQRRPAKLGPAAPTPTAMARRADGSAPMTTIGTHSDQEKANVSRKNSGSERTPSPSRYCARASS